MAQRCEYRAYSKTTNERDEFREVPNITHEIVHIGIYSQLKKLHQIGQEIRLARQTRQRAASRIFPPSERMGIRDC
jgi:predicted SprT family Zn-dependent metalloprotease